MELRNRKGSFWGTMAIMLLAGQAAWADGIWDAKKPGGGSLADNSCWQASAANMLAADGWGNAQTIYNDLTVHFGTANGGYQDTALSWWIGSHPGVDDDEIVYHTAQTDGDLGNAKSLIGSLLSTLTANDLNGPNPDAPGEGPDDPVGMAFWWATGAHAVTVWSADATGLNITDSDYAGGIYHVNWVDNNHLDFSPIYGADLANVHVGYVSMLQDVPEPSTLMASATGALVFVLMQMKKRRSE